MRKQRISGYYGYDRESTVPGPEGPPTLPGLYTNYNDLQQASDVVRFSWDWALQPDQVQPLLRRRKQLAAGPQSAAGIHRQLEETSSAWPTFPIATKTWCNLFLRRHRRHLHDVGRPGGQRIGKHGLRLQRRLHLDQRRTHVQVRRHVPDEPLQRLRPPVRSRLRRFQLHRKPACRVLPIRIRAATLSLRSCLGYADSGQIDTVRFIGQQFPYYGGFIQDDWHVVEEAGAESRPALGHQPAADRPGRSLERLLADNAESRQPAARLGAVIFAGTGPGRGWVPARWPIPISKPSVRTSASLIR